MRIRMRDPGIFLTLDPGPGMEKIRIRDKHPGSASCFIWKGECREIKANLTEYSKILKCARLGLGGNPKIS